jgi:GNAT superfamily N-acetyltransferase
MPSPLWITELSTDQQIQDAFDLMAVMRGELKREQFLEDVRLLELDGYRLVGGFMDDKLVTLAGVRRAHSLARGPYAFINDLVTHPDYRGRGYATELLRFIAAAAVGQGLPMICLNSYPEAMPFYEKLKFQKMDVVPCWIESGVLAGSGER